MTKLVDDVVGVIRHLGYDKCVLVGHGERAWPDDHLPSRSWIIFSNLASLLHLLKGKNWKRDIRI